MFPSKPQANAPVDYKYNYAAMIAGDEGSTICEAGVASPSPLFTLGTALLKSGTSILSLSWGLDVPGVRHDGSSHMMPVKLRRCSDLRSHLRQAAPVRSRARRPALMAPVLALGPRR